MLNFTTPVSCASKLSSNVAMISNIINNFFTNRASVTRLKFFFLFFTHHQIFVKLSFHYFFRACILLKNCLNKFRSRIFASKNNYCLGKFIIITDKFVSKTKRNVILIFFGVRTFKIFNTF